MIGLAALAAAAPSANADPICFGTAEDGVVCVNPDALPAVEVRPGEPVSRCVFLPTEPTCRPVSVPTYTVGAEPRPGPLVYCSGPCGSVAIGLVTALADSATAAVDIVTAPVTQLKEEWLDPRANCRPRGTTPQRIQEFQDCVMNGWG